MSEPQPLTTYVPNWPVQVSSSIPDPCLQAIQRAAPDAHHLSPDDAAAIREAREAYRRGEWYTHEQVLWDLAADEWREVWGI